MYDRMVIIGQMVFTQVTILGRILYIWMVLILYGGYPSIQKDTVFTSFIVI